MHQRDVLRGDLGVPRDELVDLGPGDVASEVAVRHLGRLAKARRAEVEAEAERLAAFLGGELALAYA